MYISRDVKEGEPSLISKKESFLSKEDVENKVFLTKGENEGRGISH